MKARPNYSCTIRHDQPDFCGNYMGLVKLHPTKHSNHMRCDQAGMLPKYERSNFTD